MEDIDWDKIEEAALALYYLGHFEDMGAKRIWKGLDWEITNRLYESGAITDPKSKAKSFCFTDEGFEKGKECFDRLFRSGEPVERDYS